MRVWQQHSQTAQVSGGLALFTRGARHHVHAGGPESPGCCDRLGDGAVRTPGLGGHRQAALQINVINSGRRGAPPRRLLGQGMVIFTGGFICPQCNADELVGGPTTWHSSARSTTIGGKCVVAGTGGAGYLATGWSFYNRVWTPRGALMFRNLLMSNSKYDIVQV